VIPALASRTSARLEIDLVLQGVVRDLGPKAAMPIRGITLNYRANGVTTVGAVAAGRKPALSIGSSPRPSCRSGGIIRVIRDQRAAKATGARPGRPAVTPGEFSNGASGENHPTTDNADTLGRHRMFQLATERLPSNEESCSQSTISRLENLPDVRALRTSGH
jgi:hypothetical protein